MRFIIYSFVKRDIGLLMIIINSFIDQQMNFRRHAFSRAQLPQPLSQNNRHIICILTSCVLFDESKIKIYQLLLCLFFV